MRARLLLLGATALTTPAAGCGHDKSYDDAGVPADAVRLDASTLSSPGIYVTNSSGTITVYAPDASGDAAPIRTIAGASTGLSLPIGIAVDHLDNLYVANRTGGTVTVYPSDADGDVGPSRTLTATGMLSPEGLALDDGDGLYVTTCPTCGSSAGGDTGVYHFAAGAAEPDRVVVGTATGLTAPSTVTVTSAGDLVVGNSFGGAIATYAAGADGDVAPVRAFTTTASNLQALARGASALAITSPGTGVDFYDLAASGTASPTGSIPTSTELPVNYPAGVYVDTSTAPETIYLADYGASALYVITTSGTEPTLTVTGVRTISGPSTQLSGPLGVAIVR